MTSHLLRSAAALSMLVSLAAGAEPMTAHTRAEVEALLLRLEASGCEFHRNGSWHSSADARAHLQRKFNYWQQQDGQHTTERFIEQMAAHSSMSGDPYLVRCAGAAPQHSQHWLQHQLQQLRRPVK